MDTYYYHVIKVNVNMFNKLFVMNECNYNALEFFFAEILCFTLLINPALYQLS